METGVISIDGCDLYYEAGDAACSLTDAPVLTRFAAGPALGPGIQGACPE